MSIVKDGKNIILSAEANGVIIAELKNKQACKNYTNCISGAFQYNNAANAVLVNAGRVINNLSAHGWLGFPDSILMCLNDGTLAVERHISIPQSMLPNVRWAISGMGLLDMYDPAAEGYAKFKKDGKSYDYSDVVRKTNHTAIGVKDGMVYGFYLANMTGAQVNAYVKARGMEKAIMLDGGHIAAVNCDIHSANASQLQHNIIQFVMTETKTTKDDDAMGKVQVYSASREGNKAVTTNFKVREYACKDGSDPVFIADDLKNLLQKIRDHFGKAVTINSAYRTPTYNKKVGGAEDSQHMYGLAADIVVKGVAPKTVAAYAEKLLPNTGGIGIYDTFTHVDVRKKKARW